MKLFLFLLLGVSLYAFPITQNTQNITPLCDIAAVNDPSITVQEMYHSTKFIPNTKGIENFGYDNRPYWVKITISNPQDSAQKQLLELGFVPMDFVDLYMLDSKGKLLKTYLSGDIRPIDKRNLRNKYHLFPLEFEANETKILILKLQNSGAMVIDLHLHNPSTFWESIYPNRESFIMAFLVIIVFFTFYNVILFFSLKEISFIYYFLAMSSMFVMQASLFGIAYQYTPFFGLWNITVALNIAGALFILFSVFFVSKFFELDTYSPRLYRIYTRLILSVYLPLIILMLFPQTYSKILPLIPLAGMVMVTFILVITFVGYKKSNVSSRYIFVGWLMSGGLMIVYIFELTGILESKMINDQLLRSGTLIEMIFFSFALGDKLKYIKLKASEAEIKALESEKLMLINARLAVAGETVGNIAHQWRQPLHRLSMALVKMQSDLYFKPNIDKKTLLDEAKKSEIIIKNMSETIDIFLNFFSNHQSDETFNLSQAIEEALFIIGDSFKNNGIILMRNFDLNDINIHGSKSEFSQVILNLLSNAQNALIGRKIVTPTITINAEKIQEMILIDIEDNAGGITVSPIEKIFEPYISTSEDKNGKGLGLYIAKNLIVTRFSGDISVKNTKKGAQFTITLQNILNTKR